MNPNAIELLEKNPNKIYWTSVSSNLNAIDFLKNNQNKLDWYSLSQNLKAIPLLTKIKIILIGINYQQIQM